MRRISFLRILSVALCIHPCASHALTDALRIRIENAKYSDETVIRFMPGASAGYEGCCDAWKLFPGNSAVPNIFTKSCLNEGLSINALPPLSIPCSVELFLRIGVPGNYLFSSKEPGTFAGNTRITLLDKTNGKIYNLRDTSAVHAIYLPVISAGDTARFRIIFSVSDASLPQPTQNINGESKSDAEGSTGQPDRFSVSMENNGTVVPLQEETLAKITAFSARRIEGKNYLHWQIARLEQDGLFVIYASADGVTFDVIGSRKAVRVSSPLPISYYFTDEDKSASGERKYYRVMYVSPSSGYMVSSCVRPDAETKVITAQEVH